MAVTLAQLSDAELDVLSLGAVINGAAGRPNPGKPAGTVTTRTGATIKTVARLYADIMIGRPDGLADLSEPIRSVTDDTNVLPYLFYGQTSVVNRQQDTFYADTYAYQADPAAPYNPAAPDVAGYGFHCVDRGNLNGGGAGGFATGRTGRASAVVANRRGAGPGHGIIASRLEDGDGFAVVGSFYGDAGTEGGAIWAYKQPSVGNGSGLGPALLVQNVSDFGEAIDSITSANNTSTASNVFQRLRLGGILLEAKFVYGGAMVSSITQQRYMTVPGTPLTGAFEVTQIRSEINSNVRTTGDVYGLLHVDDGYSATGSHWGGVIRVRGPNVTNRGLVLEASGATVNNIALEAFGDVSLYSNLQLHNIPVYADDAAAGATLQARKLYMTATGELRIKI